MHVRIKKYAGKVHPHPTHQEIEAQHRKEELVEELRLSAIDYIYRVLHHENPDSERIKQAKARYQEKDRIFRQRYGESFFAYESRIAEQVKHRAAGR